MKPVLLDGPAAAAVSDAVLDTLLPQMQDGRAPEFLFVQEWPEVPTNVAPEDRPSPIKTHMYTLNRVAGATAFYEYVSTRAGPRE